MKKLIINIFMFVILVSSCKKEDNQNIQEAGGSATVTANSYGFDGGNAGKFTSSKAGITQVTAAGITTFAVVAIKDGSNECITVTVLKKISTTGKISFGPSLNNGGIMISKDYTKPADPDLNYSTDGNGTSMQGGGEINITKLDGNNIEGTFYAIGYNNTGKEAFAEQGTFKGVIK